MVVRTVLQWNQMLKQVESSSSLNLLTQLGQSSARDTLIWIWDLDSVASVAFLTVSHLDSLIFLCERKLEILFIGSESTMLSVLWWKEILSLVSLNCFRGLQMFFSAGSREMRLVESMESEKANYQVFVQKDTVSKSLCFYYGQFYFNQAYMKL